MKKKKTFFKLGYFYFLLTFPLWMTYFTTNLLLNPDNLFGSSKVPVPVIRIRTDLIPQHRRLETKLKPKTALVLIVRFDKKALPLKDVVLLLHNIVVRKQTNINFVSLFLSLGRIRIRIRTEKKKTLIIILTSTNIGTGLQAFLTITSFFLISLILFWTATACRKADSETVRGKAASHTRQFKTIINGISVCRN